MTAAPVRRPALRVDVVTIFPDYLAPLDLSLIGKARAELGWSPRYSAIEALRETLEPPARQ